MAPYLKGMTWQSLLNLWQSLTEDFARSAVTLARIFQSGPA